MEPTQTRTLGDRRRSFRVPVTAAAAVSTPSGFASTYGVDDVSLGGALLRGAPVLSRGANVAVRIRCIGSPTMYLYARVVRHSGSRNDRPRWAIRFWDVSPEVEDAIHDLSLAALERSKSVLVRSKSVLVVDRSHRNRAELAAEIRAAGLRPLFASSPLEAIVLLQRQRGRIASALVGSVGDADSWLGLLDVLRQEYPGVRRIAVTRAAQRRSEPEKEPDSTPPLADAVLFGRWDRASLRRALGISGSRVRARR